MSSKTVYCVVCDTSNKFISCFMTQTLVDAMRSTSLHTRFDSEIFPIFSASHVGKIVHEFMNFLPFHFSFSEGEFGEKFDYLSLLFYIDMSLTALYRCEFEVKISHLQTSNLHNPQLTCVYQKYLHKNTTNCADGTFNVPYRFSSHF